MAGQGQIVDGFPGQVLALVVARREISPKDLKAAFGRSDKTIVAAGKVLVERSMVEIKGSTRDRRYVPTEIGKNARIRNGESTERVTHVGGDLDMTFKVRAIASRNGRPIDTTVRTRQATPEELACLSPKPSSAAPPAAAKSSEAKSTTSSTARPSTPAPGAASAPVPASPPPVADQPDPDAFFPDCTPGCDWRGGAIHADDCPHNPALEEIEAAADALDVDARAERALAHAEQDLQDQPSQDTPRDEAPAVEHAIHGGTAGAGPADTSPACAADLDNPDEWPPAALPGWEPEAMATSLPLAPCPCGEPVGGPPCTPARPCVYATGMAATRWPCTCPVETRCTCHHQARAGLAPVLGVMGMITERGVFAPVPSVELHEPEGRSRFHVKPSGIPDGKSATLDDAQLAREQLRARYVMRLIEIVHDQAPEHIFDRIEALTA